VVVERPPVQMGEIRTTRFWLGRCRLGRCWLGLGVTVVLGCGRTERPDVSRGAETSPALAVSAAPVPGTSKGRCARLAGASALAIGSQQEAVTDADAEAGQAEGAGPAGPLAGMAVEFARAATDDDTFLLGLLSLGKDARAGVAILKVAGSARYLDLGRVEGQTEPPRVAASGGHWLALVTDQGPKGSSLRIMGISDHDQKLETRLGPEIKKAPRDPPGADVAVLSSGSALLVWDRAEEKGESSIFGLAFDARSLREKSVPVRLSQAGHSAFEPRLVAGARGFYLLWLAEEATVAEQNSSPGLLDEPPRLLFARELDDRGHPRGAAVAVSAAEPAPLLLDARVLPSGSLLVAYRSAPVDRPTDDQPTHLATVGPGGAIERHRTLDDELVGPGAPGLFGKAGDDISWLALEDSGGTTQLARVLADGSVQPTPVTGLGGHVALAGDPSRLLTAEPRGIGASLQILGCALE
jgi:hypothetical protein